MTTTTGITNRIRTNVPAEVLTALAWRRGRFTDILHIFHCIQLDVDHWVGVAGDGDNGSYENFSMRGGRFECSDQGYGDTAFALRDILLKEVS